MDTNPATAPPIAQAQATSATNALFQINSTKLYVPVVTWTIKYIVATLTINNYIKYLENLKQGFERKNPWSKYRS